MTVCVATIAERAILIGICDRMLSTLDIEFEPEQAKIWQFSPSIFALVAGDTSIQTEILKRVDIEVKQWIVAEPKVWVRVKDVANVYCKHYRELLREQAEAAILHPLGLSITSFLSKQATMHREVVADIADRLTSYIFDTPLETIFMGVDNDGPVSITDGSQLKYAQLYVAYGDRVSFLSTVGFAAIGTGKSHAESQLMASGHYPGKSFSETAFVTYAAKKRAEVAPGVGKATDMIVVGPNLGFSEKVTDEILSELDSIYQEFRSGSEKSLQTAIQKCQKHVERIRKERAKAQKKTAKKPKLLDSQTSKQEP